MKKEILRILRSHKDYVSGQELCNHLSVSRTAIWKVMNQLKEEGYEIEAVSKRGYKLVGQSDILTQEEIESRIETEVFGRRVVYFEGIDSTNTYAKKLAEELDTHGALIVANEQYHGKGRRGKNWDSPKEGGIFMTLILKPNIPPLRASMLTLVAGLAVSNSIYQLYDIKNQIKWPNDIVINGKKVCGILTEMSTEFDYINHLVIGIGINANQDEFQEEVRQVATSLSLEYGKKILRAKLIASIMKNLEEYYHVFMKTANLAELKKEFNQRLASKDSQVVVIEAGTKYEATALGINDEGELHIKTKEGIEKNIISGEVSVRGIYGYV